MFKIYRIENENELYNIPIHYYLVGRMWCLLFNKQKKINQNISSLQLENITSNYVPKSSKLLINNIY